ncbi:alanine racemase [bacterium SCSIO 12741]|nr:alanine racemase [bacterium SCSIO 12741]
MKQLALHKTRQTVLEIDLKAILKNFDHFRNQVGPETSFVMVIKAFAYGAGIKHIAKLFEGEKVAYLAVACVDEGVELKDAGITQEIIILNPERDGYSQMIEYGLQPVLYDLDSLQAFSEELAAFRSYHKPYPVHLKLDTGMHRLGFEEKDLNQLCSFLMNNESMLVKTVLSHLVASDKPAFDDFTQQQFQLFERLTSILTQTLGYAPKRHILNSGGIERFPNHAYELVRLGIGLYGISSDQANLQNVYTWKTRITQLKEVKKGDSVSYNRSWVAQRDSKIAVIFVGYADGLNRRLGNENWSLHWKDKKVPIVGDICMDLCMVDVTDVAAEIGDELIIFNSQQEVYDMAKILGTIHYEVLTGISKRVKRVYLPEKN